MQTDRISNATAFAFRGEPVVGPHSLQNFYRFNEATDPPFGDFFPREIVGQFLVAIIMSTNAEVDSPVRHCVKSATLFASTGGNL